MTTGLKNAISAVETVQEYDENVKTILAHKIILAHILAGTAVELSAKTIIDRLERIYHIPVTEQEKGGLGEMCNLGEGILERGIQQGIRAFIELCKEMGISEEETRMKAQTKFELQEEAAREYVQQYYK